MKECIHEYFVINHQLKSCDKFNKNEIKDGESIYEVIRIINGIPLFFDAHIDRIINTAKQKNIKFDIEYEKILEDIRNLLEFNKVYEGNLKLIYNYNYKESIFMVYFIKHCYPIKQEYERGVKTILFHGERKNPNAKIINNKFREKVNKEIKNEDAYEAILIDDNGNVTEGSRSNIFMVKDDILYTAPVKDILPGVTRNEIIKLAKKMKISVIEKSIKENEMNDLDGLFISGTSPKILPINFVDDFEYCYEENSLIKSLINEFDNIIDNDIKSFGKKYSS